MIRCNNCGWFNPDSAKRCEMCDEELTGLPIENPTVNAEENEEAKEKEEQVPAAVEPEPVPAESNPMMETVRLGNPDKKDSHSPSLTQTVLDASAILESEEPVECPKCRYPVYGYADTCPNCGAPLKRPVSENPPMPVSPAHTVKETAESGPKPAADPLPPVMNMKGTVRENLGAGKAEKDPGFNRSKQTVREIPAALISNQEDEKRVWCLIPVESPDSETIYMKPGDLVQIGNRRYKFQER